MGSAADPSGHTRLNISGEMTIYTAREWRDRLMGVVERGNDIELDLGEVSEMTARAFSCWCLCRWS